MREKEEEGKKGPAIERSYVVTAVVFTRISYSFM